MCRIKPSESLINLTWQDGAKISAAVTENTKDDAPEGKVAPEEGLEQKVVNAVE